MKKRLLSKRPGEGHSKVLRSRVVGEREVLVKMMNVIEAILERKQVILRVINEFHRMLNEGEVCISSHFEKEDLLSHYSWLQENLKSTDQALDAALVHQQIMYSRIYTGRSAVPPAISIRHEHKFPTSNKRKKWQQVLSRCAEEIGSELAARAFEETEIERGKKDTLARNLRDHVLLNKVSSAAEALLTGDLISKISQGSNKHINQSVPKEMIHTLNLLSNSTMPNLPKEIMDTIHSRNAALTNLIEGMQMLESEISISTQQ